MKGCSIDAGFIWIVETILMEIKIPVAIQGLYNENSKDLGATVINLYIFYQ